MDRKKGTHQFYAEYSDQKYEINLTSLTKGQYAAKILFGTWRRCVPVRNYACLAFHTNGDNEAPRSYDKSCKIGSTGTGFTVLL